MTWEEFLTLMSEYWGIYYKNFKKIRNPFCSGMYKFYMNLDKKFFPFFLEKTAMRKQMEEEIRAQLEANADAMMSWDDKVGFILSGRNLFGI